MNTALSEEIAALLIQAQALLAGARFGEASDLYTRICELDASHSEAHLRLGHCLLAMNQPAEAAAALRKARTLMPESAEVVQQLAEAEYRAGHFETASIEYRRALTLAPGSVPLRYRLSEVLAAQNRHAEALSLLDEILSQQLGNQDALVTKARLLDAAGEKGQARTLLEPCMRQERPHPKVLLAWSRLCRDTAERIQVMNMMEATLRDTALATPLRADLHFALAYLGDSAGHYDRAFTHAAQGNTLKRSPYDARGYGDYVDALITSFSAEALTRLPRARHGSRQPIFIVGMPRSGTSLVEQILASHPEVYGAGELREIMNITDSLAMRTGAGFYPYCTQALTQPLVETIASEYLLSIRRLAGNHARCTDKMPHNFQHLGLIHLLFPEASIIHCVRDARDTCLSCYFHDFAGHHPYSYDLTDLGAHYGNYQRLMNHWWEAGIPILNVRYEALVKNPEPVINHILSYCGLNPDPRCLSAHKTPRAVRTASYDQVRRPLYRSAIGRWQQYERHLAPLLAALGDMRQYHDAVMKPASRKTSAVDKANISRLVQAGQIAAAKTLAHDLSRKAPGDAEAWFLLGAIHGALNEYAEAAECCRKAVRLAPQAAPAHLNLGIALLRLNRPAEARSSLLQAIRLQPGSVQAQAELGNALQALGEATEAIHHYQQALSLDPHQTMIRYNLALAQASLSLRHEARTNLTQVATEAPEFIEAHIHLGKLLMDLGDQAPAEQLLRNILTEHPDCADAHFYLGNLLRDTGRTGESLPHYQEACRLQPEEAPILNNLGVALMELGDNVAAEATLNQAVRLAPAYADPCLNLSKLCKSARRMDEALQWINEVLTRTPDSEQALGDQALILLQMGDYARGWKAYRHRWHGEGMIRRGFDLPAWQGEDPAGKSILVFAEQGIGDEIMFASCYADLIARAGRVAIDCAPRLSPLFARSFPTAFIHSGEQTADPKWISTLPSLDYAVAAGDLPRYFRHTTAEFPRHARYLTPDPELVSMWRSRYLKLGDGLKVGISWRGGHLRESRITRSTPLDDWQAVLQTAGAQFINIQYGNCHAELADLHARHHLTVHDWADGNPLKELDGFAAKIAALDLILSVDNSTVHLAGALGQPVWVLQPYSADWRWGVLQTTSVWYPSLRNFHQHQPGDWSYVFEKLVIELQLLIGTAS